jgi:hypothetical protein
MADVGRNPALKERDRIDGAIRRRAEMVGSGQVEDAATHLRQQRAQANQILRMRGFRISAKDLMAQLAAPEMDGPEVAYTGLAPVAGRDNQCGSVSARALAQGALAAGTG